MFKMLLILASKGTHKEVNPDCFPDIQVSPHQKEPSIAAGGKGKVQPLECLVSSLSRHSRIQLRNFQHLPVIDKWDSTPGENRARAHARLNAVP